MMRFEVKRASRRSGRCRLVAAACAALLVGACGQSDAEKKAERINASGQVYSISPQAAKSLLARLRPPTGFAQGTVCLHPVPDGACFNRHRSITLNKPKMAMLMASLGVNVEPGTFACTPARHDAIARLALDHCGGFADVGSVRLRIDALSLVKVGPKGAAGTGEYLPIYRGGPRRLGGTEIDVFVIGKPRR